MNTKTKKELIQKMIKEDPSIRTSTVVRRMEEEHKLVVHQTTVDKVKREMEASTKVKSKILSKPLRRDLVVSMLEHEPNLTDAAIKEKAQREHKFVVFDTTIYAAKAKLLDKQKQTTKPVGKIEPNILEREKISKTDLMRRYLAMDESLTPDALRHKILSDHGIDIGTGGDVYALHKKYFDKLDKEPPRHHRILTKELVKHPKQLPLTNGTINIDYLREFVGTVKKVGGRETARQLLDLIGD